MDKIRVSIIIPAYNEEKRIETTIKRLFRELSISSFEVIVSEDGSTDKTPVILEKLVGKYGDKLKVVHSNKRLGKGGGFLKGVKYSSGRYIVLLDADFPTNTETIEKIIGYLDEGFDIVAGSRVHKLSVLDPPAPPLREAMGRVFNGIVRLLLPINIHDTQCGVKGFNRKVFNVIRDRDIQFRDYVFDVELLVKAEIQGFKVIEVPIYWSSKVGSKIQVLKDAIRMFNGLLNIWLRLPGYKQRVKEGRVN